MIRKYQSWIIDIFSCDISLYFSPLLTPVISDWSMTRLSHRAVLMMRMSLMKYNSKERMYLESGGGATYSVIKKGKIASRIDVCNTVSKFLDLLKVLHSPISVYRWS